MLNLRMICKYDKDGAQTNQLLDSHFLLKREAGKSGDIDLILPDCTPGLMFIEEGRFRRKSKNGNTCHGAGKVFLFGQKSNAVEYSYDSVNLKASGYKLSPFAIYSMFGISANELTDKVIEVDASIVKDLNKLKYCLQNAEEGDVLNIKKTTPILLTKILDEIHEAKGMLPIGLLADRVGVSYKKLQRLFNLHVGMAPKLYTRIVRFNHSLRMGVGLHNSLTDVAYQSGYFDQNHYIKETKHFSGLVSTDFLDFEKNKLETNHVNYLLERSY